MDRHAARLERLSKLKAARGEARLHNHREVVAEDARAALPETHLASTSAREKKLAYMERRDEQEKEAAALGRTLRRHRMLTTAAGEADAKDRAAARKRRPDEGFSTYERATERQHERLVKRLPPKDMDKYREDRDRLGEAFYGAPGHVPHGLHEDRREAVDRMVTDLHDQIAKRQKYSRRRMHDDDADVDYINERNAKFNKKLERFFGEHTLEIKRNLERGTAV